jgi:hypothetical protein
VNVSETVEILLRPFIAWTVLAGVLGQFAKTQLWTRGRAETASRARWFWRWARKTMPLHPVVAGVFLGLAWPGSIEGSYRGGTLAGAVYFAVAGAVSVWSYEAIKGLARRYGVDVSGE